MCKTILYYTENAFRLHSKTGFHRESGKIIAIIMGRRHAIIILLRPTTHVNILFSIYYLKLPHCCAIVCTLCVADNKAKYNNNNTNNSNNTANKIKKRLKRDRPSLAIARVRQPRRMNHAFTHTEFLRQFFDFILSFSILSSPPNNTGITWVSMV